MTNSLYIAAMAPGSGKSVIALGIMELLSRRMRRSGYFRPTENLKSPGKRSPVSKTHRIPYQKNTRRKIMIIEESVEINAPLQVVWNVFSAMEEWQSWNPVCENCCIISGEGMAENTCFTFQMRPYYLPIKVMPTITSCEPGKEVIWEGRRFGVQAVHRFIFEEKENAVRLTSSEAFRGPLLWLSRLIFIPRRLHRLTQQLMASIKDQAEACALEVKAN